MSDFIRWQKNWALQIPHLDQQHVELVGHINRIADLVASDASRSTHRAASRQATGSQPRRPARPTPGTASC